MSAITVDIADGIATITLNRPKSLNAITKEDYDAFANTLRDIDKRKDILITVWQATGRWFCAGTDVKARSPTDAPTTIGNVRNSFRSDVDSTTTDCGKALYSHRKILVAALNGPVMGISAAFLGYFDFIYALPNAWLSMPFTYLAAGIVAEGGASVNFINRSKLAFLVPMFFLTLVLLIIVVGIGLANEVLIWGKRKTAQALLDCGFINKIFPEQSVESFHVAVRQTLLDELHGLDPTAVLVTKQLIRAGLNDKNDPDAVNLRESYAQAERFASGVPAKQFARIARKEIKHKP